MSANPTCFNTSHTNMLCLFHNGTEIFSKWAHLKGLFKSKQYLSANMLKSNITVCIIKLSTNIRRNWHSKYMKISIYSVYIECINICFIIISHLDSQKVFECNKWLLYAGDVIYPTLVNVTNNHVQMCSKWINVYLVEQL